jgi:polyhydroxybutyrate depolymerase
LQRNFLLYVPTSYDGANPVPLVLFFHGGENTPENASTRFGISEKAEEEGFLVAYANASEIMMDYWLFGLGWYTIDLFEELMRIIVDEIGYSKKIMDKIEKDYNIDPNRIYIAGHCNGAMMAYHLAAHFSDRIAAIASNAGCIGAHLKDFEMVTIPDPANPISIVAFHGKLDRIVPYDGGWDIWRETYYMSVADAVNFWVDNNNCDTEPETHVSETGNVTIDRYTGGDAGTEVLVYTIHNKGHIWFGGPSWEDPDPEVSTTDEMWEFFEAHPKQ